MKIGVFDSGIGGLSVANAIEKAYPEETVIYKNDTEHVPYGNRAPNELIELTTPIFAELVTAGCDVIVIACNTVSTTIIDELRQKFDVPLIGVEPLIKLASELTKTGVISVCATPTTLQSSRYQALKAGYASNIRVIEPDCSDWSYLIEHQAIQDHHIAKSLQTSLENNADVVVLGCTHYHWIEKEIEQACDGKATILQPEPMVIEELSQVLARLR